MVGPDGTRAHRGGVTKYDIVHISFGYGLFTGGFGLHQGAEASGRPLSPFQVEHRTPGAPAEGLRGNSPVGTPSYALHIAETMKDEGIGPDDLNLRIGLFGAEPSSEMLRREVEANFRCSRRTTTGCRRSWARESPASV